MPKIKLRTKAPKQAFSDKEFRIKLAKRMLRKIGPDIATLLEKPTRYWTRNKADISINLIDEKNRIGIHIYSTNKIYNLVDHGAKKHPISAFRTRYLTFRSGKGYISSTRPGTFRSRKRKSQGAIVKKHMVSHPGFEGRGFYRLAGKQYAPTFINQVKKVIRESDFTP